VGLCRWRFECQEIFWDEVSYREILNTDMSVSIGSRICAAAKALGDRNGGLTFLQFAGQSLPGMGAYVG
jgi:hypothetical protein